MTAPTMRTTSNGSPQREVLSLSGVRLGYSDRPVLDGVSLRVMDGEFWFLLGPNGSGKTTLLRSILGTLRPLAGTIHRREDAAASDRLGFVPQRCDLNPSLPTTVREFVSLGLVGARAPRREHQGRLTWSLDRAGLSGMASRDYWSLSGGQRQRALLARALIRRPSLFIVDEPTSGLDPPSQDLLMRSLSDLNRDQRLTVLFVTHDLPLAARYASHVALFIDGTIVAGPYDQVLRPDLMQRAYGLPIELHSEVAHRDRPGHGEPPKKSDPEADP
jgi:ABC-type Mn2+/Zn2+ transport system ATPase subunit